jgi:hypothetical protein
VSKLEHDYTVTADQCPACLAFFAGGPGAAATAFANRKPVKPAAVPGITDNVAPATAALAKPTVSINISEIYAARAKAMQSAPPKRAETAIDAIDADAVYASRRMR